MSLENLSADADVIRKHFFAPLVHSDADPSP